MARKVNTNNNFNNLVNNRDVVTSLEQSVGQLKKEINKKKHISVLVTEDDFEFVHEECHRLRISKNEFYKRLLDNYRASK